MGLGKRQLDPRAASELSQAKPVSAENENAADSSAAHEIPASPTGAKPVESESNRERDEPRGDSVLIEPVGQEQSRVAKIPGKDGPPAVMPIYNVVLERHSKNRKRWRADSASPWESVEWAVLRKYQQEGWRGDASEGRVILNVMKLAAYERAPEDIGAVYVESLYQWAHLDGIKAETLLERVGASSRSRVRANYQRVDCEMMHEFWSHQSLDNYLGVFDCLGADFLQRLASAFASDPYRYRKGWPDLTIWHDGKLLLREVKAPGDRLHQSQKQTIGEILSPLGFDLAVINVKAL
jgi:hypothetical protein